MGYSFQAHRISGGINADEKYWEFLEDGQFRLPRCAGCARWMWPAHYRCGDCGSWDQDWVPAEPAGSVYSWTRSWYVFDRTRERAEDMPYVVVLAELPDAGKARVIGVLDGPDTGLRIGARVRGHIDPPSPKSKGYPALRWSLTGE
jgi:uncharacterized OB-fold protein